MLTNQQLFDLACSSLRIFGNPYGSAVSRGWGWVNPDNSGDRCGLARFIQGETEEEVVYVLCNQLHLKRNYELYQHPVVAEIIRLFDQNVKQVNNKEALEQELQRISKKLNLQYTSQLDTRPSISVSIDTISI